MQSFPFSLRSADRSIKQDREERQQGGELPQTTTPICETSCGRQQSCVHPHALCPGQKHRQSSGTGPRTIGVDFRAMKTHQEICETWAGLISVFWKLLP